MNLHFPYYLLDLTHSLKTDCPSWNGSCGFRAEVKANYSDFKGPMKFKIQSLKMHAGIGTHLDAPSHAFEGAPNIDEIPLSQLIAPCLVFDVSHHRNELYTLSLDDVYSWESQYGNILPKTFIMVRTGWEKYWQYPKKYHNQHKFPSVSKEAAQYFVEKGVVGLGIDTLSPDREDSEFPVHEAFLGSGKYLVENAANLKALPIKGSYIIALPIKAEGCSEAPARLIGLIPK